MVLPPRLPLYMRVMISSDWPPPNLIDLIGDVVTAYLSQELELIWAWETVAELKGRASKEAQGSLGGCILLC